MSEAERGQWHRALKAIGIVAALALGVGLCDWIAGQRGESTGTFYFSHSKVECPPFIRLSSAQVDHPQT